MFQKDTSGWRKLKANDWNGDDGGGGDVVGYYSSQFSPALDNAPLTRMLLA